MSDETPAAGDRLAPDGDQYRVRRRHPRRDGPLVITDAEGHVLAASGETCGGCTVDQLASMVRNGYVERIDEAESEPEPQALPATADSPPPRTQPRRRAGEV